MKKRKIIRIRDGEWQGLTYSSRTFTYPPEQILPLGEPTAEEYANLCDQEAESINYHDFCGTHEGLLKLLIASDIGTPEQRTSVMQRIAEVGGLWKLRDEQLSPE